MRRKRMAKAPPHCPSPPGASSLRGRLSLRLYGCRGGTGFSGSGSSSRSSAPPSPSACTFLMAPFACGFFF
ncbi:hypothetical protein ANANG_G00300080 [Anguilla anguilla]|uniref:Uncharacterized protein n=1 Tax=Anguilla anguilla TaxID=7936 RepID=A0A9D3LJ40_ANGAN|nr:hypothetical protein ANANG_G00300080 [Anguilla anguilla]